MSSMGSKFAAVGLAVAMSLGSVGTVSPTSLSDDDWWCVIFPSLCH